MYTMQRYLVLTLGIGLATLTNASEPTHLTLYTRDAAFADVKQDVTLAIENRGFVIERQLHIGAMLERTGKDFGTTKKIYHDAEALQFCPASLSRRVMEADPSNIVFCPYTVVLYTLPDNPKKVYVGYRRPTPIGSTASQATLRELDALLDGIVREALGIKNP